MRYQIIAIIIAATLALLLTVSGITVAAVRPARDWLQRTALRPARSIMDRMLLRQPMSGAKSFGNWTITKIPSYANLTSTGWNVRLHGSIHAFHHLDSASVDKLVDRILLETSVKDLSTADRETAAINVRELSASPIANGLVEAKIGRCTNQVPGLSNREGSFNGFVTFAKDCFDAVYSEGHGMYSVNTTFSLADKSIPQDNRTGNVGLTYLVPAEGVTIVTDIDDVLRRAEVWNWKQALLSVFTRPFMPWLNMPEVLWDLKRRIEAEGQNVHIHYMTDAVELFAASYLNGTLDWYPAGTFDSRTVNLTHPAEILHPRYWNLKRLLETFPQRKFILMGDTTSSSMMKWPDMSHEYWPQIQCILMRDTQATERSDWMIPDTHQFLDLDSSHYWFYRIPSDLRALSARHLAALSPLNGSEPSVGCFAPGQDLLNSLKPSPSRFAKLRSISTAVWWKFQCSLIYAKHRPNRDCPFDRIPGTTYWDGKVETEVKLEPLSRG